MAGYWLVPGSGGFFCLSCACGPDLAVLCFAFFVVKWVALMACGADLLYQFFRMLYHWHTPGMHPGWTFLLHYGVITGGVDSVIQLAVALSDDQNRPRH